MTEPLDIAAIRAAWVAPYPLREDGTFFSVIATLCDELDRLRAELLAAAGALDDAGDYAKNDEVASSVRLYQARDRARRAAATEGV